MCIKSADLGDPSLYPVVETDGRRLQMTFPFNEVYQAQNGHWDIYPLPLANGCSTWTDFKSCLQQTSHTWDQLKKWLPDR